MAKEIKYGAEAREALGAERKNQRLDNPLRKVAASAGDVKKQVGVPICWISPSLITTMVSLRVNASSWRRAISRAMTEKSTMVSRSTLPRQITTSLSPI